MKNKLLFILGILSVIGNAQVATLEHTYTTNVLGDESQFNSMAFVTESGLKHFTYNFTNKQFIIYDENHNFIKIVQLPATSTYVRIVVATDKLFNSDSSIEFLVHSGSPGYNLYIINEDGVVLQEFGDNRDSAIIKSGTEYKLITEQYGTSEDYRHVYSLTGTLSTDQQSLLSRQGFLIPSPATAAVKIMSTLTEGKSDTLKIFDINGKLVLQKEVIGNPNGIELNVEELQSGVYIYQIGKERSKFVKK